MNYEFVAINELDREFKWIGWENQMNLAGKSNELGDMKIIQPFPTIKSWAKVKRTKLQLDKYCQISRLAARVRGKGQSQYTT